jgi:biotin transport system substrate-specific component
MGDSADHQRQADHNRWVHGAYDYRTQSAQQAADAARERERRASWSMPSWSPPSSGTGSGDGFTVIAALLLFAAGVAAVYYTVLFIFQVYLHGTAPYPYFFEALTTRFSFTLLLYLMLFLAAQAVPFFLFVRPWSALTGLIYVVALPAVTVAVATAARYALEFGAPVHDLRPAVAALGAGLPADMRLPFDVDARIIAAGMPRYLIGVPAGIVAFYILREIFRYVMWAAAVALDWSRRQFAWAHETTLGKGVLVLVAIGFLIVCAKLLAVPVRMPLGVQTAGLILVGMIYGWLLAGIAAAGWLAAALIGFPVLPVATLQAKDLLGPYAGFVVGLILAAAVAGLREARPRFGNLLGVAIGANALFIGCGLAWLWYADNWTVSQLWSRGFAPFVIGLLGNAAAAACLFYAGHLVELYAEE